MTVSKEFYDLAVDCQITSAFIELFFSINSKI